MKQEQAWLLHEKYGGEKSSGFFTDCDRLAAGEPLAYIIGHVPFLDTKIYLDSLPLIPRPETEYWVEKAIKQIRLLQLNKTSPEKYLQILDLCAGSGCIGVAVAHAIPEAKVTFAEIDPSHLPTINKNINENRIIHGTDRVVVLESDGFLNTTGRFDCILTNPPYIDPAVDRTDPGVKSFEPHLALYGGSEGLELITTIITQAKHHLFPHGQLWIEHEPEQRTAIANQAKLHGYTITTHTDQFDIERYSILMLQ